MNGQQMTTGRSDRGWILGHRLNQKTSWSLGHHLNEKTSWSLGHQQNQKTSWSLGHHLNQKTSWSLGHQLNQNVGRSIGQQFRSNYVSNCKETYKRLDQRLRKGTRGRLESTNQQKKSKLIQLTWKELSEVHTPRPKGSMGTFTTAMSKARSGQMCGPCAVHWRMKIFVAMFLYPLLSKEKLTCKSGKSYFGFSLFFVIFFLQISWAFSFKLWHTIRQW